jgi:leader peptidase (prepilin peptidase)/N-methyltransferase
MNVALAVFAIPPALALGSFLNVVAARLPEGRSLVFPRSSCRACGAEISWHDNVSVVSRLRRQEGCRHGDETVGARSLAVEVGTALLVAACFLRFGSSPDAVVAACFVSVLVVLSAIDVERRILPDKIVLPSAAAVLAAQIVLHPGQAAEWVLGAIGATLVLFAVFLVYPRGMGMGDVKLCLLLGAMLGASVVVALIIGLVAALVPAVFILARHGAAGRKMGIPFGPFLAFGAVVALFWGEALLDAYVGTL